MGMLKRRVDLPMPTESFMVPDLKKQHPQYSASVFQRELREWLEEGRVRRAGSFRPAGNRKPFYIYEPVPGARFQESRSSECSSMNEASI
jgi:hypothetical protein